MVEVDRRRRHLVPERQRRDAGLEATGRAEQVAVHRLGRGDGEPVGVLAEAARLTAIVSVGSLMGVDVPWALM